VVKKAGSIKLFLKNERFLNWHVSQDREKSYN
jgi:hypothetical protein